MKTAVYRGDIFLADLDPAFGCEQCGTRPVLVIQNNTGNRYSATTIIAAITTQRKKPSLPTHVSIEGAPGVREGSLVLLEQLRTIDEKRLVEKLGSLSDIQMHYVDTALLASLGIKVAPKDTILMTLCRNCAQSFRDSGGFILRSVTPHQDIQERCTVCNVHNGYDFEVTRR